MLPVFGQVPEHLTDFPTTTPCMPDAISEERQKEMYRLYQETGSMQKVASQMDSSTSTVRKYVKKWEEKGLEDEAEEENGEAELDFAHLGATATEVEKDIDFSVMSPGDFVQWYFEEDLEDIDVNSVGLFARRCDGRNAIPTEDKMRELLQGLPSNIGNTIQISWISEEYWSRAVEYLAAKLPQTSGDIRNFVRQNDLDWVRLDADRNGQNQQRNTTRGMGQQANPQQQQRQQDMIGSPPNQQSRDRVSTPPQPQQGGDQTAQVMQQMLEEMRRERKQMMQLLENRGQGGESQGAESFSDQIQEIAEAQQALQQFGGGDDEMEEVVNAFQQELNQIRRQIQEGDSQQVPEADPISAALTNLTQRKDIDPEVIGEVATNLNSNSDPEVKKKEIDKEIEMMKHQRREAMVEKLIDGMGDVLENAGGLAQVAQGLGNSQQQPQQQRPEPQPVERREPEPEGDDTGIEDFSIDDMADNTVTVEADEEPEQTVEDAEESGGEADVEAESDE